MRFVECCIVTVLVTTLAASAGVAQNAASAAAGVTRQVPPPAVWRPIRDSSQTSLRTHMLRGGEIGGIAGLALGGLALLAISEQGQCYTAPSTVPGLEGCSENLTAGKANKIFLGGGVLGAVIGSVLGYTYHVNVNEQRAARCRATPAACG
jgi:hypothetical protein